MHNTDIFKIDLTDCFSDFSFIMPFTDKITFRKKQTVLLPLPLPDKYLPRPTPLSSFTLSFSSIRTFRFPDLFPASVSDICFLPPVFISPRPFHISGSSTLRLPLPCASSRCTRPASLFYALPPFFRHLPIIPPFFRHMPRPPQHGTIFLPIKKTPSASGSGVLKDKKMIIYAVLANATATSLSLLNRRTANDI